MVCIKIGGRAATDADTFGMLVGEIASQMREQQFVVIHGGGAEVTRLAERLGISSVFQNGIRMTSPEEMEIVDMVLAGKMNKAIVRSFMARGVRAVGLSGSDGGLFLGAPIDEGTRTGTVTTVDPAIVRLLCGSGYLPVIASTSATEEGVALNINADEAALAIAASVKAQSLLFLSDTPGILDREGSVIPSLDEESAEARITSGVITGGMIPKIRSAVTALKSGVAGIIIGQYQTSGDLVKLLEGSLGSRVFLDLAGSRRSR